jgi:hypothetical protein
VGRNKQDPALSVARCPWPLPSGMAHSPDLTAQPIIVNRSHPGLQLDHNLRVVNTLDLKRAFSSRRSECLGHRPEGRVSENPFIL